MPALDNLKYAAFAGFGAVVVMRAKLFNLRLSSGEQTFYRWKRKYVGMGVAEVRRLRVLEEENRKLKITLEYFEKLGKAGVGFVSIQNDMDYSTPTGKFMLVMQEGLAKLYSDNLSEETRKGWLAFPAQ